MLTEHIFNNISDALDYALVEEATELQNNKFRQMPPRGICLGKGLGTLREIPWDSLEYPNTGFFNTASPDKFIMTRLFSGRYCFKPNLRKRYYLFRGQSQFYEPCTSGMFRDVTRHYYIGESVLYQEMYLLVLSHPLAQLWDLGVDLLGKHYRFEVNLFGLSQHYYNKTTLLDLTSDPDVAAFFATTKYDWHTDTYTPILDEEREGVLYCYALDAISSFKHNFPQAIAGHNLSTIGLQVFPRSEMQRGFLVEVPKNANFNTYPEVKAIRFKHNASVSKSYFEKYHGGNDLFPNDILMEHWKRENRDKKVISDKTLLLNSIFNPQKEIRQLRQELLTEGFTIKEYQPSFTEDELALYYSTAKEQWQVFCDKIHIPGDNKGKLKDALRRVPKDERYKWAFDESIRHTPNYNEGFLLKNFEKCLSGL